MKTRKYAHSVLAIAAAASWCDAAWAANKTWAAAVAGNWTTAAAWNLAGAPANGDTVLITANSASNYLVNYDNPSTTQLYPVMTLNSTGGGAAQLRTAGGTVYNITNGTVGNDGEGFWQIGGATANVGSLNLGAAAGGSGTATLNGGTLVVASSFRIASFGTAAFTQSTGTVSAPTILLANQGTGAGTYQMNGGTLNATAALGVGSSGDGTFNHAGGVATAQAISIAGSPGAAGRYNLSAGTLNAGSLNVGAAGPGTFTLSGGQVAVSANMQVGQAASGDGVVTQAGGAVDVAGQLILSATAGATGSYDLQAGTLSAGAIVINSGGTFSYGNGLDLSASSASLNTGGTWVKAPSAGGDIDTFNHTGGTVASGFFNNSSNTYIYNSGAFNGRMDNLGTLQLNADMTMTDGMRIRTTATNSIPSDRILTLDRQGLELTNGSLFLLGTLNSTTSRVGGFLVSSTPVFAHQTGIHNVSTELRVGDGASAGTYNLNNGTLNIDAVGAVGASIGVNQPGQLNLVNGRANVTHLRVGQGAAGTVNHSGGGDLISTTITVGSLSAGTYTQNSVGASVSASSGLIIGSQGRYNLSAGTLTAGQTSSSGTFNQTGGRATLNQVSGAGTMNVIGTASLTVDRIRQADLFAGDTARIFTNPNGGPNGTSRLGRLFFEQVEFNVDGRWDLTNNDLVVDYTSVSQLLDVYGFIASGYNGGTWTGDGLTSSHAATAVGAETALGYAEANAVLTSFPATFSGQTVDSTTILVRYTLAGDADLNGSVNLDDFTRLAASFGSVNNVWSNGDFDYDRAINLDDFTLLAANFGLVSPSVQARGSVPEPVSGLVILAAASAARLRRRRVV